MAKKLPFFTLDDLASMETDRTYLKILLSRHEKSGTVIRLKKGVYVTQAYVDGIERSGRLSEYGEFLAGVLYAPSYLSLEYVLNRHGIMTESTVNVTAVAKKKTAAFRTRFGAYQYHSMAPKLFCGFSTERHGDLYIFRASKAKALFDYLYFRKRHLADEDAILELRLNLEDFSLKDKIELDGYAALEGSERMKIIVRGLFNREAMHGRQA